MGFLDTVFGEPDKPEFNVPPEFAETTAARARLLEITQSPLPDVPLQGIAPVSEATPESLLARQTATELIQPVDIFSLPEVQAIIQNVTAEGNLLVNRLGRTLQGSGNLTSTTGRDVLGRAVSDVQSTLTAQLAPFASEERARRANLIPILATLGLTQEESERMVAQAEFDALFVQESTQATQLFDLIVPILELLSGQRVGAELEIEPGRMGIIEQTSLLAPFIAGLGGDTET